MTPPYCFYTEWGRGGVNKKYLHTKSQLFSTNNGQVMAILMNSLKSLLSSSLPRLMSLMTLFVSTQYPLWWRTLGLMSLRYKKYKNLCYKASLSNFTQSIVVAWLRCQHRCFRFSTTMHYLVKKASLLWKVTAPKCPLIACYIFSFRYQTIF